MRACALFVFGYLVEDFPPARKFLYKLAPIPSIREQLVEALADGKEVFSSVSLFRFKEAIMWLHVAVAKATKFDIGPPVEQAAEALDNLLVLKEALVDVQVGVRVAFAFVFVFSYVLFCSGEHGVEFEAV